ncbi:Chaperone of endosialidase, partial [Daejeonella rubra]
NAGTATTATTAGTVTTAAQPAITSVGTLTGLTVSAPITGSVTGNAGTATALATARTINGVSFDGTSNINVTATADAGSLTGATLAANVLSSSLTSVGTLGNLTVTNPIAGSITGNAGTATTATTAGTVTTAAQPAITSVGTLTGLTVSAPITGSVSGNAGTATALATARTINGVSFDGTSNINVTATADAGSLTGATLAANVLSSSLTSVGTLGNLTVTNPIAGSITGNAVTATTATTAGTVTTAAQPNITSVGTLTGLTVTAPIAGDITGSAAKLTTARTINGVSFDGTSNINVTATADAGSLTGTTLNATVVNSSLTSVGTLGNLTVTNPIAGSITGNAVTATTATTAGTVTTAAQPAITSVGTLTGLTVSAPIAGDITGSAAKLTTARTINGVSFDGTSNINVTATADAGSLTGTTLNATVVNSSLTSVGTLANLTVTNPIAGSITGNAATVTTNANLTGDVTSTGNATTISNAAVIGKLLTGYTSGAGTVAATDNILQAIQKLNGNDGLKANLASPTFTGTPTLPTGTIATTQAALNSTTAVATTAFVTTANNLKANLASPTFTGTVTLPTGTVAVTQAVNNNSTAVATTAYADAAATAGVSGKQNTLTNSAGLAGALTDETGTGLAVFATSPTLTTPVIGVATATTINKVAITAPTTGSTLTIADGKTLTASNSLTLAGTDASTLNIGTGGTLGSNAYSSTAFAPLASPTFTGTPTLPTGTIATTQAALNSTTAVATTEFVTTADNLKANLASPTFTGTPTAPTAAAAANNTQVATTAYADAAATAVKFADGTVTGNTPYWNGTAWVVSSGNIYNAGTNVGIGMTPSGSYKFEVNGKVKSTGINETSDVRWKKDILTVENALTKVEALRGVNYNWRTDEFPDKNFETERQLGLIAQEVEKVVPEVVRTDSKGFKTVEYSKLVALLLEAIKDQQKLINKQEADITALKSDADKMGNMQAEIDQIKVLLQNFDMQSKSVISKK